MHAALLKIPAKGRHDNENTNSNEKTMIAKTHDPLSGIIAITIIALLIFMVRYGLKLLIKKPATVPRPEIQRNVMLHGKKGLYSVSELKTMWREGKITLDDYALQSGKQENITIRELFQQYDNSSTSVSAAQNGVII